MTPEKDQAFLNILTATVGFAFAHPHGGCSGDPARRHDPGSLAGERYDRRRPSNPSLPYPTQAICCRFATTVMNVYKSLKIKKQRDDRREWFATTLRADVETDASKPSVYYNSWGKDHRHLCPFLRQRLFSAPSRQSFSTSRHTTPHRPTATTATLHRTVEQLMIPL